MKQGEVAVSMKLRKDDEMELGRWSHSEGDFRFFPAITPEVLNKCLKIRYDAFVSEMGQNCAGADHEAGIMVDAVDEYSIIIAAAHRTTGEIVGTARLTVRNLEQLPDAHLFDIAGLKKGFSSVVVISKMAIKPECRKSGLFVGFSKYFYRWTLGQKIAIGAIGCRKELVRMYTKLGFCLYKEPVSIPGAGEIYPMIVEVFNRAHLERTRSPFLSVHDELTDNNQTIVEGLQL
jgi:predicted GNAT family N-acyltransferase